MTSGIDCDEQAGTLRGLGRSFGEIAQILEIQGATEAAAAFNRALRGRPKAEQARLRSREAARLDVLALRVRWREDLSGEEVFRHLHRLQHQRTMLFVA